MGVLAEIRTTSGVEVNKAKRDKAEIVHKAELPATVVVLIM